MVACDDSKGARLKNASDACENLRPDLTDTFFSRLGGKGVWTEGFRLQEFKIVFFFFFWGGGGLGGRGR